MKRKPLNPWLQLSIDYANQRSYLDDLFQVYPTIPEGIREIDAGLWENVEIAFAKKDNSQLLESLLKLELFPIKNSYVAYLRRDPSAIYENSSKPKETNTQIGPHFRHWLQKKPLGIEPVGRDKFLAGTENAILDASDAGMMTFAREHFDYRHTKGLDFIARFNGKYVIGEAKFLTDFGGHQNAQFNDAIATVKTRIIQAVPIAILDGVLYIPGKNKMYRTITGKLKSENIMSSLVLREFLYQL